MDDRMNIVIGSSKELALFSLVTLKSLFVSNKNERFNIFFYYHEEMDDILNKIGGFVTDSGNSFFPMRISDERMKGLTDGGRDWWHESVWYRYYCVEDLHEKYDRALIVGTDVLIRKEISEFYNADIGDKCLCSVLDMGYYILYPGRPHKEYGLSINDYVNTDIVMLDLKKSHGIIDPVHMVEQYNRGNYWALDQDVINFDYREHLYVETDMHYNFMPGAAQTVYGAEYVEEMMRSTFVHLATFKPWNEYDPEYGHDLWLEYVRLLPDCEEFLLAVVKHMGSYIKDQKMKLKNEIDLKNRYIYKVDKLYWASDKLFSACRDGVVRNKLENKGIRSVAIYGCGKLGKQLLRYCIDNGIEVTFFIDASAEGKENGIDIIKASEIDEKNVGDAVIVTPFYMFEDIAANINNDRYQVISLEEIIDGAD